MKDPDIDEQTREVQLLNPASIRRSPYQVRTDEEPDDGLVQSIATHGLLNPITVRADVDKDKDGAPIHELIAGHRRLAAWINARGSQPIPAIVLAADDMAAEDLLVAENFVRKDLTPIEQALTVQQLRDHGRTVEQTATVVRKSTRWVQRFSAIAGIGEPWRSHLAKARASYPRCLSVAQLPAGLRSAAWDSFCSVVHDGKQDEAWWKDEERGMPAFLAKLRFLDAAHCPFDCGRACRKCAKRSDHAPELWDEDAARSPRCLDPQCYDRHVAEAEERRKAKEAAAAARSQSLSAPARDEEPDERPIANAGAGAGAETSSESPAPPRERQPDTDVRPATTTPSIQPRGGAGDHPDHAAQDEPASHKKAPELVPWDCPQDPDFFVQLGALWAFDSLVSGKKLEDLLPALPGLDWDELLGVGLIANIEQFVLPRLSRNRESVQSILDTLRKRGIF